MIRIFLGVLCGLLAWVIIWVGIEKILSAMMPVWYGAPQLAFQRAIENGGDFTAETRLLIAHIIIVTVVALISGFAAAVIAGETRRAPLILGLLLLALGLVKVVMSWPYVPMWYHILFTAILLPMTTMGGKLRTPRASGKAYDPS